MNSTKPLFYPNNYRTPMDSICRTIIQHLEAKEWKDPEFEIFFKTLIVDKQEYSYVHTLKGRNFTVVFGKVHDDNPAGVQYYEIEDEVNDSPKWFIANILSNINHNPFTRQSRTDLLPSGHSVTMPVFLTLDAEKFINQLQTSSSKQELINKKIELVLEGKKINFTIQRVSLIIGLECGPWKQGDWRKRHPNFLSSKTWLIHLRSYLGGENYVLDGGIKAMINGSKDNAQPYEADDLWMYVTPLPFMRLDYEDKEMDMLLELSPSSRHT